MSTEMLQYLDPDGLDETVLNIGQIKTNLEGQISDLGESIEEELQDLPYARPDGIYPDMTVGAVIGADSTAQWAQRESTGSGTATVRSVQGATEVQNDELVPVQIAGIRSTDAQGGELDSVEWTAQTLRAAGSVADKLYSDHVETKVALVDLGTFNWQSAESTSAGFFVAATDARFINEITCIGYGNRKSLPTWNSWPDMQIAINVAEGSTSTPSGNTGIGSIIIKDMSATGMTTAQFKEHVSGIIAFIGYNAANITTTPISPALPMTYRVQTGGSESIIVPDGEVSAAPVLTIAEPVNAGDEFARIWAAIESLGYTRNTAQVSRPVSLTDIGSIDEVQKDTADVVEIETTKEVQE